MKLKQLILLVISVILTSLSYAQDSEIPRGFWEIPKTDAILKIGGYVKLDMIHDFDNISSPFFFDVATIATDGSKRQETRFNARESRFKLDFRIPNKDIKMFIETDFYGANNSLRLRHAYVTYKGWLAGQSWSNFMDENIVPSTLDFEKPLAYALVRHAMLRYKFTLKDNMYLSLALEQPSANGQLPAQAGAYESNFPDLTARYRITENWGHAQLSAYLAQVKYRFDAGGSDDLTQMGVNLSLKLNLASDTYFTGQLLYGSGMTRYRGGESIGLDANGNIESISEFAFTTALHHAWDEKWKSLVVYNHGELDNTAGQPSSDLSKTNYFAVNTTYNLTPSTIIGLEYLNGSRENINGAKGGANRIQFSFKQSINM